MRTAIVQSGKARRQNRRQRREAQDRERQDQDGKHRHLHFLGFDLLAQIFRRAAHHQAGHEHGDDGEQQHAVEAGTDAAEDDLAQMDVDHGDHAGQRHQAVMHGIDRAAGGIGGDGGEQRRIGDAEADFLAFHIAAGLKRARGLIDMQSGKGGIAAALPAGTPP